MSSADCFNACLRNCFSFLDTARTKQQLRVKKSLFISWLKATLNKKGIYTPIHHFFFHLTSPLLALFPFVSFCFTIILHFRRFKKGSYFRY